jgi:hypothetical protein
MKQMIPQQHTGAASETVCIITAQNEEDAKTLFTKARKNLLNVNNWEELAGGLSASFQLVDEKGHTALRTPQIGDYFKISIPAPGNESGKGHDWVKVEDMEDITQDEHQAFTAVRVRPTKAPAGQPCADSHHFFTQDATSTFYVKRDGKTVSAAVLGRNEKPNTKPTGLLNKVRNLVVGCLAAVGFNKPQWRALAKGILEKDVDAITFRQ